MRSIENFPKLTDVLADKLKNPDFAEGYAQAKSELNLAIELSKAREARHLTQAQLAEMTGIKQQMLSRIERGQVPELPSLAKIATALNIRVTLEPDGSATVAMM